MGSAMVQLDSALLSSYRLSSVCSNHSAISNDLAVICDANFDWGSDHQNIPFPWGLGFLSNTVFLRTTRLSRPYRSYAIRRLIQCNGSSRVHECDRRPDGQTTLQ